MSIDPTVSAARVLDVVVTAEMLLENARRAAQPKAEARHGTLSAVVFRIGPEWLALPSRIFREIAAVHPVHRVPHRRSGVLAGLVNVRGHLVPCVALGPALGLATAAAAPATPRLAVIGPEEAPLAFVADEITAVLRFDATDVQPPPTTVGHARAVCTRGILSWNRLPVGLLDDSRLLPHLNTLLQ